MAFYIPNSQYKKYESFDFNGRPSTDASFRNAFVQSQAPMLLAESGGGGGGGGGGLTSVVTSFPNIGTGTFSDPVTFAPAPACGRTFFWDGTVWQQSRNTGITEVTVGDPGQGANYKTVQEALACSSFVRVINDTNEPLPLVLPSRNVMIYVDPGINLTLAPGAATIADDTSLTFRGSASQGSSLITFRAPIQCNANTRLYFYDCRVVNNAGKSLIITNTANYGFVEAYHSNFVAGNFVNSLFGEGNSETIVLELQDCAIESGGDACQFFIGTSRLDRSVIHIRGLNVLPRPFANKAVLANTVVNECLLSDINIFAGGDPNVPYEWFTSGMVTNFKQATGASSIQLNFLGGTVDASNLYIRTFTVGSTATNINNVQTTTNGTISLSTAGTILSNGVIAGSLSVDGQNCKVNNCECLRLFVNGTGSMLDNVRASASVALTNVTDVVLTNVYGAGGLSLVNSSQNNFVNCVLGGCLFDAASSKNTFTGGRYDSCVVNGPRNTFTGINFQNITGTFTASATATETHCTNCRILQVSWAGADGVMADLDVPNGIFLIAGTAPNCIITGCRVGQPGLGGANIDVASNTDVVITNCIVGKPGVPAHTIINILAGAPGPTITLISNCKTSLAIAASAAVVNCSTF